jgi:hypothetical protein
VLPIILSVGGVALMYHEYSKGIRITDKGKGNGLYVLGAALFCLGFTSIVYSL